MDGIFCLLNKQCRTEKSKELVDNLHEEQKIVEEIYSKVVNESINEKDNISIE